MTASEGFVELLQDALSGLGPVSVRRMFGGAGVYAGGVMFALVSDDTLYLKADAQSQPAFEAEGLGPFVYRGRGRTIALSYWRIPERLLDDPDEMLAWARRALAAAHCATQRKRERARPRTSRTGRRGGRSPLSGH